MENQQKTLSLHKYAEQAYLEYAVATVKGRALAQVEDGQKPVHRRILYAMLMLGLLDDAKPVKCARIVGDVLGKYHPHGDTAAYDALVRLAQDFSLRYPLIRGQGNFGSRDDDPAAAMRYTEANLAPVSRLLLDELRLGTVDFVNNYDGSHQEPSRLPDRLPFLLLNGTMGIAVGMAANIPSHNLREVASAAALIVSKPDSSLDEVLSLLPGPDFPDGGQVIASASELKEAYASGRGAIRMRGRWHREELARGQWQLVIDDFPFQVSARHILEQLDLLTNPKIPAGKKALTQQQLNLRQLGLELIERASDEAGKEKSIRLVVTPRNSKVSIDELMAYLFANTSLESNFSMNCTLIGLDGRPRTMGLMETLQEWADFRVATVRRRVEFSLSAAEKRIHVLKGRALVVLNLDEVVRTIRESDEPRQALMSKFGLSEIQADDALEMRLRQLNRLEGQKLARELEELNASAQGFRALLESEAKLRALIVSEIHADSKKFGDDRRTLIKEEAKARSSAAVVRATVDDEVTLVLSKNLWIRTRPGHEVDVAALAYRAGDEAWHVLKTRTSQSLALLDSAGRTYSIRVSDIPSGRGDGVPVSTLIDLQPGGKVLFAVVAEHQDLYLFSSEEGYGLVAPFKSLMASKKAGKAFLDVPAGVIPLEPIRVVENKTTVFCLSEEGKLLMYPVAEVKTLASGGKGVKLMELGESKMKFIGLCSEAGIRAEIVQKTKQSIIDLAGEELNKYLMHRGRKGYQVGREAQVLAVTPL